MSYETILIENRGAVGVVQLNRPKVLNALSLRMMDELVQAIGQLDRDDAVRAIVLTGSERAFAAGADISEMAGVSAVSMLALDQFQHWQRLRETTKPLIAAVSGYAFGGGCELAMLCDMIVAAESAQFGQPEIRIGVMPGAGGTQLLTRALGKWRAMEIVLTGRPITAREALELGLVNRVVPTGLALDEALGLAAEVASMPPVAVRLAKEAVQKAFVDTIEEGLPIERRNFYLLFATEDRTEGMRAFLEKREPRWQGK